MAKNLKTLTLFLFLSLFSNYLLAQIKGDNILQKINVINKRSRIWFLGKSVNEIYLNSTLKKLDVDDCSIPLERVEINYRYSGHWVKAEDGPSKTKYHGVYFTCISGANCISINDGNGRFGGGFTMFFKTKKDCYSFINLLNELKTNLE